MKKNAFSLPLARLFTRGEYDAYDLIHFREPEWAGDDAIPAIECPENWSIQATEVLATAAAPVIPAQTRRTEENTVPSWLWCRIGTNGEITSELSAQQIFTRVVGSATYTAWKLGLIANENDALIFFDEARYALAQRFIAIEPQALAKLGLDWAYGLKTESSKKKTTRKPAASAVEITNAMIDGLVSGSRNKNLRGKWQKSLATKIDASLNLNFSDVAADWGKPAPDAPRATIDLLALRHNDGTLNIDAVRHVTRLLVILLDMHAPDNSTLSIGFNNLAPLLMAQSIAYDSKSGRALAASIAALITAEAYATSAEIAHLLGASTNYIENRDITLRALRNHRRAIYGDRSDYEKISVLPTAIGINQSPDLAIVASAQRRWDEALDLVKTHGARHTHVTSLAPSPTLALFTESYAQGLSPMQSLSITESTDENFRQNIHPSFIEALTRLGYSRHDINAVIDHILGTRTLEKAPVVNHTSLMKKGFGREQIDNLENYLSTANDIRLGFTHWILGEKFVVKTLKVPAAKLKNPAFNLLKHLGFSEDDIALANTYCYGHGSAKTARALRPQHRTIFATASEISNESKIAMAASVQSFISSETGLNLRLSAALPTENREKLLLSAWRQGVRSLVIAFDSTVAAPREEKPHAPLMERKTARKLAPSAFIHAKKAALPGRKARLKATTKTISSKHSTAKSHSTKRH